MACTNPLDAFRIATESLPETVHRSASASSIWLNLVPRAALPLNVGTYFSSFAIGNTEPTDEATGWTTIDQSNQLGAGYDALDSSAELCTPSWSEVSWGYTEITYSPELKQLMGPVVCRKDLLFNHSPGVFLSAYVQEVTKRVRREWEINLERQYVANSRKASVTADFEGSFKDQTALTGMDEPTGEFTQEVAEIIAQYLNEDGAATPDSNGFINLGEAGPEYSLLIGQYQSQRILRQNSELRNDYRYGAPSELLKRLGATRVIGNFRHIVTLIPRRATFSEGTFTIVPRWANGTPTKGTTQVINPSWRTAPYEEVIVLNPGLIKSLVPNAVNSAGGLTFPPADYNGNWQFVTGAHKWDTDCLDPMEDKGRHFAELIQATEPNPVARYKYGYSVWFKRCLGNSIEITTCSS